VVLSCLLDVFLLFDSPPPKETQYCPLKNAKTNFLFPGLGGGGGGVGYFLGLKMRKKTKNFNPKKRQFF
jgi:hypothetical protein